MTNKLFSDETLMAYADGELDDVTTQGLRAALKNDPALVQRLNVFADTRAALSAPSKPEPVPEVLLARVRATLEASRSAPDNTIVPFTQGIQPRSAPRWQPMALAASLALAVGLGAGFGAANLILGGQQDTGQQVSALNIPGLDVALSNMASGETLDLSDGALTVVTSFRSGDDALCREYEFDARTGNSFVSVACRTADRWDTRLAIVTHAKADSAYAPASSLDTLEVYLSAIGAGAPLSAKQEVLALGKLGD